MKMTSKHSAIELIDDKVSKYPPICSNCYRLKTVQVKDDLVFSCLLNAGARQGNSTPLKGFNILQHTCEEHRIAPAYTLNFSPKWAVEKMTKEEYIEMVTRLSKEKK